MQISPLRLSLKAGDVEVGNHLRVAAESAVLDLAVIGKLVEASHAEHDVACGAIRPLLHEDRDMAGRHFKREK